MVIPSGVYLALSDLVNALKREKEKAMQKADKAALMNADDCAFWSGYACGLGDALIIVEGAIDSL